MIEQIKKCNKCRLCCNQKPLLDKERSCQIFWVGLSAKKITSEDEIPLSPKTNTGMIIQKVEGMIENISTYKTNLVKCVPLNQNSKLRYPNKKEIDCCFFNLEEELNELSPKIVFLLGEKVYTSVERHLNIKFEKWNEFDYRYKEVDGRYYIPIHHPSYISVYKRKQMEEYINSIEKMIFELIE